MEDSKRATVYFDADVHRALRLKAAASERPISDLVNGAVKAALAADVGDRAAFSAREPEKGYPVNALNLDPQLLSTARQLAAARSVALGVVISELASKGLEAQSQAQEHASRKRKSGFPVFKPAKGGALIGLEDIKRDED